MGLIELIIVVLLVLWAVGYFGRGRLYGGGGGGSVVGSGGIGNNWVHILLVIVVILIVLRLLGVA
jgi:Family of unknown function (DUF5670)